MQVRLSLGWVRGGVVICPRHTWKFQLADGRCVGNADDRFRIQTHEVRIVGEDVQVRVTGTRTDSAAQSEVCEADVREVLRTRQPMIQRRELPEEFNPFDAGQRPGIDEHRYDGES